MTTRGSPACCDPGVRSAETTKGFTYGKLAERDRPAFAEVVRAARQRWDDDHADTPAVVRRVAEATAVRARTEEATMLDIVSGAGARVGAVFRLFQLADDRLALGDLIALARWGGVEVAAGWCCDSHGRHCEPPGDLCCAWCTEVDHPRHPDGVACTWLVSGD